MPLLTTFRSKFGLNLSNNISIEIKRLFKHKYLQASGSETDA